MAASALFTDVNQVVTERRVSVAADEFIVHLSTISAYLILPTGQRTEVLSAIRSVRSLLRARIDSPRLLASLG